ncbi:hypothetical protein [Sedimenticola sp.]
MTVLLFLMFLLAECDFYWLVCGGGQVNAAICGEEAVETGNGIGLF